MVHGMILHVGLHMVFVSLLDVNLEAENGNRRASHFEQSFLTGYCFTISDIDIDLHDSSSRKRRVVDRLDSKKVTKESSGGVFVAS